MAIGDADPERPPRPLLDAGRRLWEAARLLAARDAVVGELKAGLAARLEADAGSLGCLAALYRDGGQG